MKKLVWYHELGFFNNPFSTKPAAFHNELMGYDQTTEEISEKVAESDIILISGEYGTGKTTVLKRLISEFKGGTFKGKKVIYYNCNQSEKSIDYNRLLINAGGFLRRLFRIRKRNMIILLDEAQDMNRKDAEQVKNYYDEGFFKSVILVSSNENIKLTKELEKSINRFKLGNISREEAVEMIRKRIGSLRFISDQNIIKIFNKNTNPRAFLKNSENVCRYAFENGDKEVAEKHIKKVLR